MRCKNHPFLARFGWMVLGVILLVPFTGFSQNRRGPENFAAKLLLGSLTTFTTIVATQGSVKGTALGFGAGMFVSLKPRIRWSAKARLVAASTAWLPALATHGSPKALAIGMGATALLTVGPILRAGQRPFSYHADDLPGRGRFGHDFPALREARIRAIRDNGSYQGQGHQARALAASRVHINPYVHQAVEQEYAAVRRNAAKLRRR